MNWTDLLNENRVEPLPTARDELDALRSIVNRCMSDVKAIGLSQEQQFIIAYDAARTLAMVVVRASGYRPRRFGGHYNTFAGLEAADPAGIQSARPVFPALSHEAQRQ